jgi:hypothetical protein
MAGPVTMTIPADAATPAAAPPAYPAGAGARGAIAPPGALLERPISLAARIRGAPRAQAAASGTNPFLRSFR